MAAGWGEIEVLMDVSSRRLALVQHCNLPAHGLLSFLSLFGAFLLNATRKRNQEERPVGTAPARANRTVRWNLRGPPLLFGEVSRKAPALQGGNWAFCF